MRMNRLHWLVGLRWAGPSVQTRGIPELLHWMRQRGYIQQLGTYTVGITEAGIRAIREAVDEHARHGRTL